MCIYKRYIPIQLNLEAFLVVIVIIICRLSCQEISRNAPDHAENYDRD
jgi:hypothetical protein